MKDYGYGELSVDPTDESENDSENASKGRSSGWDLSQCREPGINCILLLGETILLALKT